MDTMSPPAGGNQDRGPSLTALFWVFSAVAIIAVSLRFAGRRLIHATGPDDWAMLFALVLLILLSAFTTYMVSPEVGGARHLYYLTAAQKTEAIKYNWASQQFAIAGFAAGKVSIGLLILRILSPHSKWRRWTIYVLLTLSVVISIVDIILSFAQCNPPRALWEPQLVATGQAKCLNPSIQSNFAIFLACWNVFVDAALAVLPVTLVWGLNMSTRKRVSCSILLSLGLLAAVCGAVKAHYLVSLTARSDLTWETYNLFAWSGAELFVIIVCGSIAPIKPLWDRFVVGRRPAGSGYNKGYTGPSAYSKGSTHRSQGSQHLPPTNPYSQLDDDLNKRQQYNYGVKNTPAERPDEYEIGSLSAGSGSVSRASRYDGVENGITRTTEVSVTTSRMDK